MSNQEEKQNDRRNSEQGKGKEKEPQSPATNDIGQYLQVPDQTDDMPQGDDEWANIEDPDERRKVQNRLAQRKFRERSKQRKEESHRDSVNRKLAGGAYSTPEPDDLGEREELSGVPWGSINMGHVIKSGKARGEGKSSSQTGSGQASGSNPKTGSG